MGLITHFQVSPTRHPLIQCKLTSSEGFLFFFRGISQNDGSCWTLCPSPNRSIRTSQPGHHNGVSNNIGLMALEYFCDFITTYRGLLQMNHGQRQAYRKAENASIYQLIKYINCQISFLLIATTYAEIFHKSSPSQPLATNPNESIQLLARQGKFWTLFII